MGEVWQARDTTLDRDVALKVLPEAFTSDPDRLARFEREAKVLASLNHPNIGSIYGLEEAEGVRALVLELVEGPTLAERITQGPIPWDEALPIAKQIAEALEAAHEQGVIHRDLKPANVKVKADGTVKVLDFGLAKAFQPDASDANLSASPTISLTAAATQMSVIVGTAAYMAPEQASGKTVDKRADVWAFGVVLFEMLTGTRPFVGDDVSKTLAHVIAIDPDWSTLQKTVPPVLGSFLRGCLEKNPKQRVHDVAEQLTTSVDGSVSAGSWTPDGQTFVYYEVTVDNQRDIWMLTPDEGPVPVVVTAFNERAPHLSPDGQWLAYVTDRLGQDQVVVQPFPGDRVIPISIDGGREPVWSRDGRELFYRNGNQMVVVDVETEPEFTPATPRLLFEEPYVAAPSTQANPNYDVSLDGQQFLMVRRGRGQTSVLTVVQNWFEELRRLLPVN